MKIKELIKLDLRIPNHEKFNRFRKFIEKTLNKKKVFISILKIFSILTLLWPYHLFTDEIIN
jgi:hypothetical protein